MNRKNNALVRFAFGMHTCRYGHEHGPAKYTLIFNTENVLAFGINIKVGEAGQKMRSITQWFSRDQFSDWLQDALGGSELLLGFCAARISKSKPDAMTIMFPAITLQDGETRVNPYLMLSREYLQGFLRMTYYIVPRDEDSEGAFLQVDACIEKILNSSK